MNPETSTPATLSFKTFVLVGGTLYKVGRQRIADALNNFRTEPAFKGMAVKVWDASISDNCITFGASSVAVFNDDGNVNHTVRALTVAAQIDGQHPTAYVEERLPRDAQVQKYLALAAQSFSEAELFSMARAAKALPTK